MSWPAVPLGKLCTKVSVGHVGKTSEFYTNEAGIRFLRTQNVSKNGLDLTDVMHVTAAFHEKLKKSQLEPGDVVLSRVISNQINCAVIPEEFGDANCANIILARPEKQKLDSRYLYYFLKSNEAQRQLLQRQVGSAQSVVNTSVFKSWEMPLPPLAEQKRIAVILDKADAIRQKRKQAIELADEFLRSVFLDMFGDPVTNPKGWEVKACKDVFERITVGIVVKPSSYYVESGIPALRSLNIGLHGINAKNLVYVSEPDNESRLAKTRVYEGDLVMVRSGQPGKTAVVTKDFDGVNAIDILIATPKAEQVDPDFFAFFMNSEGGKNIVLSEQRGQVQKHFNVGSFSNAELPLPPLALQREFSEIRTKVCSKYQHVELLEYDVLASSLAQKAFSGEL